MFSSAHSSLRHGHGAARLLGLCRCPRPESSHHLSPQTNPREDPFSFLALEQALKTMDTLWCPPRPPLPAERGSPGSEPSSREGARVVCRSRDKPVPSPPFTRAPGKPIFPHLISNSVAPNKKKTNPPPHPHPMRDPLKLPSALPSSLAPSRPQPTAGSQEGSSWAPASAPMGLCQARGPLRRRGWGTMGSHEERRDPGLWGWGTTGSHEERRVPGLWGWGTTGSREERWVPGLWRWGTTGSREERQVLGLWGWGTTGSREERRVPGLAPGPGDGMSEGWAS